MARSRVREFDVPLFTATVFLVGYGLFVLTSASFGLSTSRFNSPFFFISRQMSAAFIGIIGMYIASHIPYRWWKKLALPILFFTIILLASVLIPSIGASFEKGASRWIDVGPISFQPAEFVKFSFIIYLAAWLDAKKKRLHTFNEGFLPFLCITGIVGIFLLAQPNISALILIGATSLILFIIGEGKLLHTAMAVGLGILVLFSYIVITDYNMDRITTFLNPENDPQGEGYQIRQALIAIGSGGFFGRGFGKSEQKFSRLPEPVGDSIFAVYSEELGYVGNLVLLGLFLFFIWRGMLIAVHAPDRFGKLLGIGIVSIIGLQFLTNIAAFTGLVPVTGIPLPFISYGRSALLAALGNVGILLNISRSRK